MNKRRIGALGAAAGLCAGLVIGGPSPSGAAVPTDFKLLAGNFVGDERDEMFYYAPGTSPDYLGNFTQDGTYMYHNVLGEFTVNGTYRPLVGDFDGDGYDEILWYAAGTAPDYMWNFTSETTRTSVAYTANGNYPGVTVGDYTADGADDVLWYAPGTAPDYLWDYEAGGTYTSTPRTINGKYVAVSGSFGNDATDDVFWYAAGTAADYLWDYVPGSVSYSSHRYNVNGTGYRPFALDMFGDGPGNEDIFWYGPGSVPDSTWDFFDGALFPLRESVSGEYVTTAGDFFGDGADDIVFMNYDRMVVWEHTFDYDRINWIFLPSASADVLATDSVEASASRPASVGTRGAEQKLDGRP